MDINAVLAEALASINAMTAEEFRAKCMQYGYEPVKKERFIMTNNISLECIDHGSSYKQRYNIENQTPQEFGSTNELDFFMLAA